MEKFEEIPRGQLSTIILMTLEEKDKYGYEIIEEVLKKTNGRVSIKQPSLYSSLKRMEEQSLISSYWRESEIGGKRHYYHLSNLGKKHLDKWKGSVTLPQNDSPEPTKVLQQENLFNLSNSHTNNEQKVEPLEEKDKAFIQFDLFSNSTIITPPANEAEEDKPEIKNNYHPDAQKPIMSNYEKELTENEIKKFDYVKKTNKSFFDDIKTVDSYDQKYTILNNTKDLINSNDLADLDEKASLQTDINLLDKNNNIQKNSTINNAKNITLENNEINSNGIIEKTHTNESLSLINDTSNENEALQTIKDDGIFITERLNPEDLPSISRWNKIDYSKFNNANLRDSEKFQVIANLYNEQSATQSEQSLPITQFNEFLTDKELKAYYESQNIYFSAFKKRPIEKKNCKVVNINKLNMLLSLSLLIYSIICSLCVGLVALNKPAIYLNHPITFLIIPFLLFSLFVLMLIKYIKMPNKKIEVTYSKFNIKLASICLLIIPIIFAICLICGLNQYNFGLYFVLMSYPACLCLIYFIHFTAKNILIKILK